MVVSCVWVAVVVQLDTILRRGLHSIAGFWFLTLGGSAAGAYQCIPKELTSDMQDAQRRPHPF